MSSFRLGQKVKYSLKKDAVGMVEKIELVRGTKRFNYLVKYSDEAFSVFPESELSHADV